MNTVMCNECGNVIGVLPLGWDIPQFMICIGCRTDELNKRNGDEE